MWLRGVLGAGVGALIVRRDALEVLLGSKAYFGGGTVAVSLAEDTFFRWGGSHWVGGAVLRPGLLAPCQVLQSGWESTCSPLGGTMEWLACAEPMVPAAMRA